MVPIPFRPPAAVRSRLEALLQQARLAVSGLPTVVSQTFILSTSPLTDETVLWLARSPQERDQLFALLQFWFSHEDGVTPELVMLSDEGMQSPTLPPALLSLLEGTPTWVIASAEQAATPLPGPSLLQKSVIEWSAMQSLSPAIAAQDLAQAGYEFNTAVTERGTFARRGGIIDVWPFDSADPIRLDILDQRLNSINTFNWKTQRNREAEESIKIPPRTLPKAREASIADYLQQVRIPTRVLMPDTDELEAVDPKAPKVIAKFAPFRQVVFMPFNDNSHHFDIQAAPLFHRDFEKLKKDIIKRKGWTISILTSQGFEVKERLGKDAPHHIVETSEDDQRILRGFISEQDKYLLLTDWEIFGRETHAKERRSERADIVFLAELNPGDYVVHLDHGIGRFSGTTEQEVNGQKREYFVVTYASDDKLYVPVELADKLSKYIGVANPKLHRLSGTGWYQMTKKIKEETKAIAEELLKLYAQRETVTTEGFAAESPQERELAAAFPYEITPDQRKAIEDIEHDLRQVKPMDRLICGDVGFGKTEVAIRAAFKAVMNKKQVVVLSPTTILTQQHYDTFRERLEKYNVRVDVLSRFRSAKQQKETLERLKLGQVDIIIGTHRLLQNDVHFKDLGLVIIDEEQRFGVQHKERLKTLRLQAHVLTLTATPIPRTLNFALAGIRDVTVIETPPEGRKPIETHIESYHDNTVKRAIDRELERKGQAYFVYNNVSSIHLRMRELAALAPNAKFAVAHGQMPEDELAKVMAEFDGRKIDVLVCSTIIENGLDLPNVNTMIVDHATQFGLAQLYQLRGRIGRGSNQAYSYFLYHTKKLTPEARKRLQALLEARELGSGFQLALRDLEIRGTGSILGKKQHGHVSAVGLSLYSRLLSETIQEMRTGVSEQTRDILIDLPLSIRIPKELETNEQKRLAFYQKLALENTIEGLKERVERLFHRKVLPESVQNLIDVLTLKILGQKANISGVALRKSLTSSDIMQGRLTIDLADPLVPGQIKALIEDNGEWQFGESQIKIPIAAFGKEWMKGIHHTLEVLAESRNIQLDPAEANGKPV